MPDKILALLIGFLDIIPLMVSSIILILLSYAISHIIAVIVKYFLPKNLDISLKSFFPKLIKSVLFIFGCVYILSFSGVSVGTLTAMMGFSTIALGLCLKDMFVDTLHGIMILLTHPIKAGDFISIEGFSGTVLRIDLMHTKLECDGEIKLIPNTLIFTKIVGVRKD